jgi:hypothetical protein
MFGCNNRISPSIVRVNQSSLEWAEQNKTEGARTNVVLDKSFKDYYFLCVYKRHFFDKNVP